MQEHNQSTKIGNLLRDARREQGSTLLRVAAEAGISHSSLLRIENGEVQQPTPAALTGLSRALGLPLADLFAAAGYIVPAELPSFKPYFRARYGELPDEAANEVEWYVEQIAKRYGVNLTGPAPGEDE